jgi:uncharacterized protein (DUF2267 family)
MDVCRGKKSNMARACVEAVYRTSADRVPSSATVCHYDELPPSLKERFHELVADVQGHAPDDVTDGPGTFVKYTDYYYLHCE